MTLRRSVPIQRLLERGKQARKADRPAIFRPGLAVRFDPKVAVAGERNPGEPGFEILISQRLLDRNSNVYFHKCMAAVGLQKSLMHGLVQSWSYINS
jgi:hypothetical protein